MSLAGIHHDVTGTGPVVLFSHGFQGSSRMWTPTVAAMAADHTAITWDILGHGRSASPDDPAAYSRAGTLDAMRGLLAGAGAGRAVLVGHSLGGYLSLDLAITEPQLVGALVLVDSGPGFRSATARAGWNQFAEDSAQTAGPGIANAARGILRQDDGHVIDALESITVPVLVVVGALDDVFLPAADYMAARIPGASRVVIDGAGHAPPVSHPAEFVAVLSPFLASLR
ncbi:MAG: alpha/beta fold hydrolase [Ilumatobacteraceae bacterium]